MPKLLRLPVILALSAALVLGAALPALADQGEHEGSSHRSGISALLRGGDDEGNEHGGAGAQDPGARSQNPGSPAVAPAAGPAPVISPADVNATISVANQQGNPQLTLPTAIAALVQNPMNAQALGMLRGLATAGPSLSRLWVDGRPLSAPLLSEQGHLLVPLGPVAQSLSVGLVSQGNGQYSLTRGNRTAALLIGSTAASVGGLPVSLDVAPVQAADAVYVSLRSVADLLGTQVLHDTVSGLVIVNGPGPG